MSLLRALFGPSQAEIWQQLSLEIGAHYTSGFWTGKKVQAEHREWMVTLDTFSTSSGMGDDSMNRTDYYTRLRAPYVNRDGFRFEIFRKHLFSTMSKWMGSQDVEVGFPEFDDAFIIRGNSQPLLRQLFANTRIRQLIETQPSVGFSVRGDQGWFSRSYPEGVDELYFVANGIVTDLELLKLLFDLFSETLDHLCKMGSAYKTDPGVIL